MKRPFGALPLFINKPRKAEIIGVITTADFPNISNKSVAIKLDIPELFNISAIIEDERRIYTMFKDEYKPQHLIECIKTAYQEQPAASRQQIIPIIFNLLSADSYSSSDIVKLIPQKSEYLKPNQWDTLSQDDLRFIHSQLLTEKDLHKSLLEKNLILEIEKVLLKTG